MSEYLTHGVHGDDCAALASLDTRIGPRFRQAMADHKPLTRMGSVLRSGRLIYPAVLLAVRNDPDSVPDTHLAIALSQLSHRAADTYFKPLYQRVAKEWYDNDNSFSPSEMRILQDTVMYYQRRNEPYAKGDPLFDSMLMDHAIKPHLGLATSDARHLERLFGARVLQELTGLHSPHAETADTLKRMEDTILSIDPIYIDTMRYADLASEPFIEQVQRYIIDENFYDPEDPLIKVAIAVQNGLAVNKDLFQTALAAPDKHCQWSESLIRALDFLAACQAFVDGEGDLIDLERATLLKESGND